MASVNVIALLPGFDISTTGWRRFRRRSMVWTASPKNSPTARHINAMPTTPPVDSPLFESGFLSSFCVADGAEEAEDVEDDKLDVHGVTPGDRG